MTPALLFLALQADGIAEWIDGLGDEDVEVRESATQALRKAGDRAIPALLATAEATDPEVRSRALDLLWEAARRAPTDSLCLSIDDSSPGDDGIGRVTLRAMNEGLGPVLVHRPSLGISGLACSPPGNPVFAWLEPGDSLQIEMEGPVFRGPVALRPYYLNLSPTAARTIKILPLANVDPSDTLKTLEDLFIRGTPREPEALRFACDPRTRAIIVEGNGSLLEIVKQVVTELDGAAIPAPRRFRLAQYDASTLELMLKELLLPAAGGRK